MSSALMRLADQYRRELREERRYIGPKEAFADGCLTAKRRTSHAEAAKRPTLDDWFFVNWFISRGRVSHNPGGKELRRFLRAKSHRRVF